MSLRSGRRALEQQAAGDREQRGLAVENRIKQFSADDLLALSRGFDLPIGYVFTPPPPADDIGLYSPDAPKNGLDPIVLLDAVPGTPDNLERLAELLKALDEEAPDDIEDEAAPAVTRRRRPAGGSRAAPSGQG